MEQNLAWGEVRITDPGSDLKVTKVDVVPLQIEAAANQALTKVGWFSTVNGASESAHELAAPTEPRYAVYQPTVYLDELHLSDWDVMKARCPLIGKAAPLRSGEVPAAVQPLPSLSQLDCQGAAGPAGPRS